MHLDLGGTYVHVCAATGQRERERRVRFGGSLWSRELVAGDVMRSDYRLVRRLAAKGWPVIPPSLKERFVKSGREEGEEGRRGVPRVGKKWE